MSTYFSTPTSRAGYIIRDFLNQIGVPIKFTNSSWKTNKLIFVPFLKENNLPYKQMNPKYKGINTADLQNCYDILEKEEIWEKFRKWCKLHKEEFI